MRIKLRLIISINDEKRILFGAMCLPHVERAAYALRLYAYVIYFRNRLRTENGVNSLRKKNYQIDLPLRSQTFQKIHFKFYQSKDDYWKIYSD